MNELKKAFRNVKILLANPFSVPRELDTPRKLAYHNHYVVGAMLTMLFYPAFTILLKSYNLNGIILLISVMALSFMAVLIVSYLKELLYDKWYKQMFIDIDDIRYAQYGWVVVSLAFIPITIFVSFL